MWRSWTELRAWSKLLQISASQFLHLEAVTGLCEPNKNLLSTCWGPAPLWAQGMQCEVDSVFLHEHKLRYRPYTVTWTHLPPTSEGSMSLSSELPSTSLHLWGCSLWEKLAAML